MAYQHVVPTNGVEKEPFIPYVKEQDYPPNLSSILAAYVQRMGFVPNALKLYMHRPEIAAMLWTLNSNIMRDPSSTLDQGLKRRLATVCSRVNGCTYCTTHHCAILKAPREALAEGWDLDGEAVKELLSCSDFAEDELERACFDFARAASEGPQNIGDEIYERLRKHLTPPQIVELACVVGFWKMYNTIHDALRVPLEAHLVDEAETLHAS